jgi:cytochrome P450 family 142 subfamily A polypeptide 1
MPVTTPCIDLLSPAFYLDGARDAYRWMRRHSPVHFDEKNGLWGVATWEDVDRVGRDPASFSSAGGSRPESGPLPWMIDMDGAAHQKRRKLVSRGFTPRRVAASEARVRRICDELIDRFCERGECDFVRDLAAPLPLIVIGDMLGFAPEQRPELMRWSHDLIGSLNGDPERVQTAILAFGEYAQSARREIAARRTRPADDLLGVLVRAEVDGQRLSDDEVLYESLLLLLGGDETTRNVTSGGMHALLAHPAEMRRLLDDPARIPVAVEELLRWVSPIKNMARTVTRDLELGGRGLRKGERLVVLYESANFDEARFEQPERLDVLRSPNEHVAFGSGAHFCLGASLARLELRVVFEQALRRLPDPELATREPLVRLLTGLEAMPVRFTPTPRVHPEPEHA